MCLSITVAPSNQANIDGETVLSCPLYPTSHLNFFLRVVIIFKLRSLSGHGYVETQ